MRPDAQILLDEAIALRPILEQTPPAAFDRAAACAAIVTHVVDGTVPGFTPADNQCDVDATSAVLVTDLRLFS